MGSCFMSSNKTSKFHFIKSKYILQQVFAIVYKKKKLQIIKYNKEIQKRIDININDYKNYCEIIIEITPMKNINFYLKNRFINIPKGDEPFYHIYFDDNNKEIKDYYIKDNIKKIKVIIDNKITSFFRLFEYCKCIESISFIKFRNNNITNMRSMFYECTSLKNLDLSNFCTDNVNNMCCMFYNCKSLEKLDLSNFDTQYVTTMKGMFYGCKLLKKLNLSHFNSVNLLDTSYMFYECRSLKILKFFKIYRRIIDTMGMFDKCRISKNILENYYYEKL